MHPARGADRLLARYPDLPNDHAVFMAGLYSDIQAKISEFRVSQMERIKAEESAWQADLALAQAASGLQGFLADIMDPKFRR